MEYHFSIPIEVISKKNLWTFSRQGHMYLPKNVADFISNCVLVLINQKKKYPGFIPLKTSIGINLVFYNIRDKDLDNQITTVFDLLQKAQIIENDKFIDIIRATKTKTKDKKKIGCQITLHQ